MQTYCCTVPCPPLPPLTQKALLSLSLSVLLSLSLSLSLPLPLPHLISLFFCPALSLLHVLQASRRMPGCFCYVMLCCALFWSGPNAVVLCFCFFLLFVCLVFGVGLICNLGHACSLSARRWFLVSVQACVGVFVCVTLFSIFLYFLPPGSMCKNTNNNNNKCCFCHNMSDSSIL